MRVDLPGPVVYRGVVGSVAYGLARQGSDVDIAGVFVAPSRGFWGVHRPQETFAQNEPDETYHEIGKFARLALKCNPTLLELLWLPTRHVLWMDEWGAHLRACRSAFLSEPYVRSAFGGYAYDQLRKLERRHAQGKEGFSADTAKRTAKHARHLFRLIRQGRQLLETGSMDIEVPNPAAYWAFDDMSVEEIVLQYERERAGFDHARCVLPSVPDVDAVEALLQMIRQAHFERVDTPLAS